MSTSSNSHPVRNIIPRLFTLFIPTVAHKLERKVYTQVATCCGQPREDNQQRKTHHWLIVSWL